ncbi:hypothetical protein GPECTOR_5g320 [Gonium pectorale]|uniref:Uncharacterized protein n=1 Tax=Gonium pectorale TaxID=33097 RepID=A0A150GWP9_GONPE|nr:hypothetical protein GPECTOR_5g320 [Gonium pectorale]|eukprot:KXZ54229.1 hypothetical protein GPECTOR_5g320 [Gonium pectorale]
MSALHKQLGLPAVSPPALPPPSSGAPPSTPQRAASEGAPKALSNAGHGSPGAPSSSIEPMLLAAVEAHFPNFGSDDADYLATAACYCLATRRDPKSLLPPLSLHLTDLTSHLCGLAAADARLAAVLQALQRGGAAPTAANASVPAGVLPARVGELLAALRSRHVFRQSESLSRKGERVVSLALEQLLRGMGGGKATTAAGGRSGAGMLLEAWQRADATAAAAGVHAGGGASPKDPFANGGADDGLPVFLFEYELPGDLLGGPVGQRDQFVPTPTAPGALRSTTGGGVVRSSPQPKPLSQQSELQQPQQYAALQGPPLSSAASAPSAVEPPAPAAMLQRRSTEPPAGHLGAAPKSDAVAHVAPGSGALAMEGMWGGGAAALAAEGSSPVGSLDNMRFPLFQRSSNADSLYNQGQGPAAGMAPASTLSASPAGHAGELHVPREIADVWSNAAAGAQSAAAGMTARRGSLTAVSSEYNGLGGLFAMSPTQESSSLWERVASREGMAAAPLGSYDNGLCDTAAGAGMGLRPGAAYPGNRFNEGGAANGGFGGNGSGQGGLVVGSAPPGMPPLFFHPNQGPMCLGGNVHNAQLMDYISWQSSSPELSSSVGGRSAPADEAHAGAWLLARSMGARSAAAGDAAGARPAAAAGASRGSGGTGAQDAATAGGRYPGGGASLSVSEENEEAASVVGGLELDPLALTLESIIGFDPSSQPDLLPKARLNAQAGKGLIAAAAAPKAGTATTANPAPQAPGIFGHGGLQPNGPTADGSSTHSSLDSSDALGATMNGLANGNGHGVLTGWSAMAARGPMLPHAATGSVQLSGTPPVSRGAGGVRPGSSPMQHHGVMPGAGASPQGLAATMAAIGAAAAAAARPGSLGMALGGVGMGGMGLPAGSPPLRDAFGGKLLHPKLTQRVREEICALLRTVPGLKVEDFDDGVLHQLTLKKSEEEAVGALRMLAAENVSGIQHMAAYINHTIKNYHLTGIGGSQGVAAPGGGAGGASLPSATVRANSTPVSSKAILQRLPLRVYKRLEEVINKCSYMEWKHFDAGVVKVMAQLAEIGEDDVFEELELLKSTDLSNVEYMPAYLNKRLNNRLWSRRKMLTSAAAAAAGGGMGP